MSTIIGLDLSYNHPGVCIIDTDLKIFYLAANKFKHPAKQKYYLKSISVLDWFQSFCASEVTPWHSGDTYCMAELTLARGPAATYTAQFYYLNGMFHQYLSDVESFDIVAATTLKKAITGDGKADKDEMKKTAIAKLKYYTNNGYTIQGPENWRDNDNITDAICCALYCAKVNGVNL